MLALTVVAIWFGLVAVYLVRQWWVSELAQAREGVPAPAPAPLPAAAPAARPAIAVAPAFSRGGIGGGASVGRSIRASGCDARWGRVSAPTFT